MERCEIDTLDPEREIPKKTTYYIRDMDITFNEEINQEEMEYRFFNALHNIGVIRHRGRPHW